MLRYLSISVLLLGFITCGDKPKVYKNVAIEYDDSGYVKSITILAQHNFQRVNLNIDKKNGVTELTCYDSLMQQSQKIGFYKQGGIGWIGNYIHVNSSKLLNQTYDFDRNFNINDTASFFAIIDSDPDSSRILYLSNYKNRIRKVFLIDSITHDLLVFHPVDERIFNRSVTQINSLVFDLNGLSLLKFAAYRDSIDGNYTPFYYFYNQSWRKDINYIDKAKFD